MRVAHISWNLVGLALPLLIAAVTVPHLLQTLGGERFGLLALAWGLIGYAGALDLGIGRATTQRVAALRDSDRSAEIAAVVATATRLTLIAGGVGMLLIFCSALLGIGTLLGANEVPHREIQIAILLLGLALPMQAVSATYRGVNEAYLSFRNISVLRIVLGAANFGLPFLITLYSTRIDAMIASLVVSRGIALFFYRKFAFECLAPCDAKKAKYSRDVAQQLFRFGGWFTVSSVISPILVQADRFLIAALVGASMVTIYVIPYELTVQSLILSSAVTTVAFPAISRLLATDNNAAQRLFQIWLVRVTVIMAVALSALAAILPTILSLWLHKPANSDSVLIGRILCFGVLANSIGAMYFSILHAKGRTKITALFHIFEFPLFIGFLILLIHMFGVVGAALAWSTRMIVDAILMMAASRIE